MKLEGLALEQVAGLKEEDFDLLFWELDGSTGDWNRAEAVDIVVGKRMDIPDELYNESHDVLQVIDYTERVVEITWSQWGEEGESEVTEQWFL